MATGDTVAPLQPSPGSISSARFRALRHRNFQLFVGGQLVSLIGTWIQNAAQLWLVYRLTGSAALLGVFGFASQIPMLLLSSVGGYVGDRYSRHRGVIATQAASMILAFLLAALTLSHRIQGRRGAWVVIVIGFLQGIVNAFDVPIRQSFFVNMVGKADLPNAIALNSSVFNGARVVGPAIAGFAIKLIGEGWCFFVNGLSFLAVIFALVLMRIEPQQGIAETHSAWRRFLQGFRFAMGDRVVRSVLILLSMLSFFGLQYSVFMPIFAKDILHREELGYGLLMSASAIGAVLGSLQFAARTKYKGMLTWVGTMFLIASVGLIVFSQSRWFALSAVVLLAFGFSATSQMAATNTTVQNRVPDELRSRVMAVYATMFMGVQPIGSLVAGPLAKRFGAPMTLAAFGSICLVGSLIYFWRGVPWARSAKPVEAKLSSPTTR
ncbi:MAG TPA: MFS transporter [Candidatus Acidoferrum sp.]|nr:MFS transporter [Candidatus Acidoferrum sp.]